MTFIDLEQLKFKHRRFLKAHYEAIDAAAEEAAETGVTYAKQYPKFNPQSGALQEANEYRLVKSRGVVRRVALRNKKPYAAAIDRGARPHAIRAKSGGVLRFRGRSGGLVYAREVRHPGNKPYRFLHDATLVAGRKFHSSMGARMNAIARRF